METKSWLAPLIVAGAIQGCSTPSVDGGGDRLISVALAASPQNAGQLGQATLAASGDETAISFFIGGVPAGTTRPLHLYTFIYAGSCRSLGARPAYEMNQTVTTNPVARRSGWMLSRRAPVALSALRAGGYAIVVRTSPADGNLEIFCGDIR
jgi:hypothetical protein